MDTTAAVLFWSAVVFAALLAVPFVIARLVGGNERGNDDHEFTDPPDM